MSMNGNTLGTKWWNDLKALQSFNPALTPAQDAAGAQFWQTVANDLVAHIIANAVVQITSFTATASGVTTGTGNSGNITGTATGVIQS